MIAWRINSVALPGGLAGACGQTKTPTQSTYSANRMGVFLLPFSAGAYPACMSLAIRSTHLAFFAPAMRALFTDLITVSFVVAIMVGFAALD